MANLGRTFLWSDFMVIRRKLMQFMRKLFFILCVAMLIKVVAVNL